jgi:hypothetical protein
MLFLFFGYFGGKNTLSRSLLVFGAPLSILLQTRYLKLWLKTAFYMFMDPPPILLSLLSAPQQAMLLSDWTDTSQDLNGKKTDPRTTRKGQTLQSLVENDVVEDDDEDEGGEQEDLNEYDEEEDDDEDE